MRSWSVAVQACRRDRKLLRVERVLRPEAAADVGRDHPHGILGEAERLDQHTLGLVGHLGRVPDREQIFERIEARDQPTRLDRMAAAFVHAKMRGHAMRGAREGGVDVAVFDGPVGDEIVGAVDPRPRRARCKSRVGIDHGGKELVVEFDQARRVLGDGTAIRHHQRDRLAHISKLALGEPARIDVVPDRGHRQRQRDAVAGQERAQVAIGEHRVHPGQAARRRRVDAAQQRMRDRAAHEGRVQHPRQRDIVDEAARAAQQRCVFEAPDRPAHPGCAGHQVPLTPACLPRSRARPVRASPAFPCGSRRSP
jgi:hypothetical protein